MHTMQSDGKTDKSLLMAAEFFESSLSPDLKENVEIFLTPNELK